MIVPFVNRDWRKLDETCHTFAEINYLSIVSKRFVVVPSLLNVVSFGSFGSKGIWDKGFVMLVDTLRNKFFYDKWMKLVFMVKNEYDPESVKAHRPHFINHNEDYFYVSRWWRVFKRKHQYDIFRGFTWFAYSTSMSSMLHHRPKSSLGAPFFSFFLYPVLSTLVCWLSFLKHRVPILSALQILIWATLSLGKVVLSPLEKLIDLRVEFLTK